MLYYIEELEILLELDSWSLNIGLGGDGGDGGDAGDFGEGGDGGDGGNPSGKGGDGGDGGRQEGQSGEGGKGSNPEKYGKEGANYNASEETEGTNDDKEENANSPKAGKKGFRLFKKKIP